MSAFALKMIAVISMCFDHFGYFFNNGSISWCNYLGRLAFPIFAFQISEGYTHTHNLKRYFWKLFLFAIISQIPFNLFEYSFGFDLNLNIFFTLLLGLSAIYFYDKSKNKFIGLCLASLFIILGEVLKVDYGYLGVFTIFAFFILKKNKLLMTLGFLGIVLIRYVPNLINFGPHFYTYLYLALFTFLAIIPIVLYNGKLGPKTKYLLYVFYPLHLFIIAIARLFM